MDDLKPDAHAGTETSGGFADLLEANRPHRDSFSLRGLPSRTARGLAVVTCMDTRLDPLAILGLRPGDAKITRNAGARVTDDVVRSLALATALLGVTRIAVVAHTDCAMAKFDDTELRARVAEACGAPTDTWSPLAVDDQLAALRSDVQLLQDHPLIPDGVAVAGFVYDVDNGELRPLA